MDHQTQQLNCSFSSNCERWRAVASEPLCLDVPHLSQALETSFHFNLGQITLSTLALLSFLPSLQKKVPALNSEAP